MKLGIIGTGMIVKEFLPVIKSIKDISINSLLSTTRSIKIAEDLATSNAINFYTDNFSKFLNSDIDTVYIATPNILHHDYAMKCLNKSKNVIIEKPFATTLQHAKEVFKTAKSNNLFAFEAITTQYLPSYKAIKDNIAKIGDVISVECNFCQHSSRYNNFKKGLLAPVFNPAFHGGALMDLNSYNIHFAVALFGEPKSYSYKAKIENGIDTSGIATLSYENFDVVCTASKAKDADRFCKITGEKGTILTSNTASIIDDVTINLDGITSYIYKQEKSHDYTFNSKRALPEFLAFAKAIDSGNMPEYNNITSTTLIVAKVLDMLSIFKQ